MSLKVDKTLGKRILRLAYPVTIAMLTQTAINLVDTIMVGRLDSEYSIAGQSAIAISLILLWAVGGLISSISVGTQALAARRFGEGQLLMAGKVLNNALIIGSIASVIATIGVLIALPYFYPFLHSNPSVVTFGIEYSTFRFLGIFSMVLTIVYKGFFDGIGRTKVHMTAAISMNVVNVVLNYCLIFGVGPFPRMNVAGAGLASLIATFVGLFIMLAYSAESGARKRHGLYSRGAFDWKIVRSVVKIGIPGGLATLFVMTGFGVFITIVGWLDQEVVHAAVHNLPEYTSAKLSAFGQASTAIWTPELHDAALGANPPVHTAATKVIMDIMSVVFMTCMAFGQATATLVGQSLGARDPDLAEAYGWESVKIGAYFMGSVGLLIGLFPDIIAGWFNPDVLVISTAHSALQLMAVSSALIAVGMILAQALFGAGVTVYVMVAELLLHFFCLIPVAYLFGIYFDWGLVGIWGAALTYIVGLAAAMAWKFQEGGWKENRI